MRRIARSVLALGVLVLSCLVLPGHAQSADPARQFVEFANAAEFTPAVQLASQREMTVVLKLADDPVAVVRSRRADKRVSDSERNAIEADLRGKQQALLPSIRSHGGRVRAMFQNAINGVKVQATRQQIAAMAALPGVVDVKTVALHHLDNAVSVPFIGAPSVWQGPPGLKGEHIRIAVIDTGIDYTHANFGGPGTVAAFVDANARSTLPADPALFGPAAPKVKGGTDLVGDDYDPGSDDPAKQVPHPDPNPLDCNGHGSHVAGTAAGFGVTAGGLTFHGPYDATTPSMSFRIGPGVAPLADLYAVRVFGCQGGTDVVIDAIDWAVQHDMQVINMSLGAPFGTEDSASAEASENAVDAGIVVAAASGNDGPIPYVTSSPASGDKVISVAAIDSTAAFAGVNMALNTGVTVVALNANIARVVDGTTRPLFVLPDTAGTGAGGVSLGCDEAEYGPAVVGKIVVTLRGVCARVNRAIFGQTHGAAAVVMINNAPGYPPVEGPIPGVTIPFLGVLGTSQTTLSADGNALKAAATATLSNTTIANPTFRTFASFTSSGPRTDDGHVKPNITAPGVSINSTNIGTGNDAIRLSGTSMATPHVAGVAALTIEAHPDWTAEQISHAIVNTGDPDIIIGRSVRNGGAGLVRPLPATRTSVIAMGHSGEPSLSFGVEEFTRDFSDDETLTLQNLGNRSATFAVSVIKDAVSKPHSIDVNPSIVSVGPHGRATLHVKLNVPIATVGNFSAFRDVGGIVRLTPMSATANGGAALSVPYYLVARARSEIETKLKTGGDDEGGSTPGLSVRVDNKSDTLTGTADFYAWGLAAKKSSAGVPRIALRAGGVQSFDLAGRKTLVFAVNTVGRWSSASMNEIDVLIDVNNDGTPDFLVVGADLGLLQGAGFSGQIASAVFNLSTGRGIVRFLAVAPNDGNTILLPVRASDVSVTAGSPRFAYTVQSFDLFSAASDAFDTAASFNAFTNAISTGAFVSVGPGGRVSVPITVDPTEFAVTPALGVMTVSLDNVTRGHRQQAQLLKLKGDDGQ